jgi:predicted aconitase with swiveling domain
VLVAGRGAGELLVCHEPLSFWGGYDPATGEIIDRRHPLSGVLARGRILAIPGTKGSSTTTAVLLEAIRRGTAPSAIVTVGADGFVVLAAIVAEEMYDRTIPVLAIEKSAFDALASGGIATVEEDGSLLM